MQKLLRPLSVPSPDLGALARALLFSVGCPRHEEVADRVVETLAAAHSLWKEEGAAAGGGGRSGSDFHNGWKTLPSSPPLCQ